MTIKHLTLLLTGETDHASVATCGMNLAKQLGAHVAGCYEDDLGPIYTAPMDAVMPQASYGLYFEALQELRKDREARARRHFEQAATAAGVPLVESPSDGRPSAAWTPGAPRRVCAFDTLTDLVVVGAPGSGENPVGWNVIEHALFAARRRLLVVPPQLRAATFSTPLVAWNGSHEAENAVERAIDLLKSGTRMHVVQVGHTRPGRMPARRVVEYLQWHGFEPTFDDLGHRPGAAEDILLQHARSIGADCVIMGAYTHSRTRELLFGGVTDFFLRHSHIPLLMAH